MNIQNSDLTSFASLLGNSFASKIDLLSKILQNAHYPSIGRYKENLLIKIIREYLPDKYKVGTGFVLFVHDATEERALKKGFDHLNMGSYTVSKQCDILIYDASTIPVVFKDDDFVILRPESVKAVIEVKSNANKHEIDNILEGFIDFGKKWQQSQKFYKKHQQLIIKPRLFAMCWGISKNKNGKETTNGTKVREQITKYYDENVDKEDLTGFPILEALYVYNDFQVSNMVWIDDKKVNTTILQGWGTSIGKFVRYDNKNEPYADGDSTISRLLANIHWSLGEEFNRFYSYHDEIRGANVLNYQHDGFSPWLFESKHKRALNLDHIED
ncbi:DUF6602 domain-containing protein [Sulfuricurvum sp.]|uniref:DUF6602 domain-containing protein n=1 Tax=Sulfuricurvum sp. TaxID=2025608 RepID=UPI002606A039|nr:DUF6602 domain-containing protein [Sulfuricurvum sp.]MDD3597841.1 hypothetical protein [Sulfuricurvum sp.]